jgi:hypothetical protein
MDRALNLAEMRHSEDFRGKYVVEAPFVHIHVNQYNISEKALVRSSIH